MSPQKTDNLHDLNRATLYDAPMKAGKRNFKASDRKRAKFKQYDHLTFREKLECTRAEFVQLGSSIAGQLSSLNKQQDNGKDSKAPTIFGIAMTLGILFAFTALGCLVLMLLK